MHIKPKISVIMPNFNYGAFIKKSIESILNQTLGDLELIVVDDASTDDSCDKIESFKRDSRLITIKLSSNVGNYKARNIGINNARANYIAVMDADDVADLNRLAIQFNHLKKKSIACLGSQGYFIDKDDNIIGNLNKPTESDLLKVYLLKNNFTLHPSLIYNKALLRKSQINGYDESILIAADYDFVARCSTRLKIENLADRLIYYRAHEKQISNVKRNSQINTARLVRFSLLKNLGIRPSKDEMTSFNNLMEDAFLKEKDFDLLLKLLNRIMLRNSKEKQYKEPILHDFLQTTLKRAYQRFVGRSNDSSN